MFLSPAGYYRVYLTKRTEKKINVMFCIGMVSKTEQKTTTIWI